MKKWLTRILCVLALTLGLTVSANAAGIVDSGYCGGEGNGMNLTWSLDSEGTMSISGFGRMANYSYTASANAPWRNHRNNIRTVVIAQNVASIGDYAFYQCSNLTDVRISDTDNTIAIGMCAFMECNSLEEVTVPSNVSTIGDAAFLNCRSLMRVNFTRGLLRKIGRDAFSGCTALCNVSIPYDVTTIGERAFQTCVELTEIVIPSSVTSIGNHAFELCLKMESITVENGNSVYASLDGVLFNADLTELLCYPAGKVSPDYPIPDGVVNLADMAFRSTQNLVNLTIPSSMTVIPENAFWECGSLMAVAIPAAVTSIGDYAFFADVSTITDVYYGGNETQWKAALGEYTGLETAIIHYNDMDIPNSPASAKDFIIDALGTLCEYRGSGGDVIIPNDVVTIGNGAFRGNTALNSVSIPGSVKSIGEFAFADCQNLQNVTIEPGLTSVGWGAFYRSQALTSIVLPNSVTSLSRLAFEGCANLRNVVLSENLEKIEDTTFWHCNSLETVSFSAKISSIGQGAFAGCDNLRHIYYDGSESQWEKIDIESDQSQNTAIASAVVHYKANGTFGVSIRHGYCGGEGDGTNLFWRVDKDGTLTISGMGAMCDYPSFHPRDTGTKFSKAVILEGVTNIGQSAFSGYADLVSVSIPNTIVNIGYDAFCRSGLREVSLPNSVVEISDYAFNSCEFLEKVTLGLDTGREWPDWKQTYQNIYPFAGCPITTLAITCGSVLPYSPATPMGNSSYVASAAPIYHFFGVDNSIQTVILPNGIKSIAGFDSFFCPELREIYIPKSVSYVYANCFSSSAARNIDLYYEGSRSEWVRLTAFGNNVDDPIFLVKMHYGEKNPGYQSGSVRAPTTVSTSTGTSRAKAGTITVEFKGGVYEKEDGTTDMSIRWGFSLFDKSSDVPQNDLAIAALVLSANANAESPDQVKKTLTETQYTINEETKETRNGLGFSNFAPYNYDGYDGDLDRVGYVLASKVYHNQNIIAIVCRGTVTGDDILSDFVTQADGFRRAANNVMNGSSTNDSLAQYIAKHNIDTSLPTKYFITGHSRGGAVANILGQILSDSIGKENVYVYTFACPNLTTESNRADYTNIHNIVNTDDLVPTVPPVLEMVSLFPLTPPVPVVTYHPKFGEYYEFTPRNVSGYDSCFRAITGLSSNVITDLSKEFEGGYSFQFVKLRNHAPAVYMSFLRAEGIDGMVRNPQEIIKGISVRCPVDVLVYDGNGNYLGAIRDNVPDNDLLYSGVYAVIEGDEKYLYVLGDTELSLELVGTDTGTMTYSVEEVDAETGEAVSTQTFSNVALSDGKTMTSAVAGADTQLLVTENGEVSAMVDENGGEADAVLLSFVTGLGSPVRDLAVAKGESVSALPEPVLEGYRFTGWCRDEDLTVPFDQTAAVTAPMTLYASYEEALPVYGLFTDVNYDGEALSATLRYDYNRASSDLYAALYQDGQMLDVRSVAVASGAKTASVSFAAPDLNGAYTLKAFTLDGGYAPISTDAAVSFFAD